MSSNTRDKILNSQDATAKVVDLPEWGVKVEVRSITAKQRMEQIDRRQSGASNTDAIVDLVIMSCFDPDSGEQLFDPADRDMLLSKNASAFERLWKTALELSGLNEGAAAAQAAAFQEEPGT